MLSDFENFVRKYKLFSKKDKLLLAISGGMDSVCLFHLLLKGGYTFSVAHCNFQLRGKESKADEEFVRKLAEKYKIPFYVKHFETKKLSASGNQGIQELARNLRYKWFQTLSENERFSRILTAHHQSDTSETILINLMRNTGIAGLHGIPLINGNIVRPLLFTNRSSIESYMKKKGFSYRNDSSNKSDDYLRNRIRHHIIPALQSLDPSVDKAFYTSSENIREFEELNTDLMQLHLNLHSEKKGDTFHVSNTIFKGISNASALMYHLFKEHGFSKSACTSLINSKQTGKKVHSETHTLIKERQGYVLLNKTQNHQEEYILDSGRKQIKIPSFLVSIKFIKPIDVNYKLPFYLYFDAEKIEFPLRIRNWKHADRMRPLGLKGSKKISDILTDKKVSHHDRETRMVLESKDGTIMALIPEVCSELYRVEKSSKRILAMRFKMV